MSYKIIYEKPAVKFIKSSRQRSNGVFWKQSINCPMRATARP